MTSSPVLDGRPPTRVPYNIVHAYCGAAVAVSFGVWETLRSVCFRISGFRSKDQLSLFFSSPVFRISAVANTTEYYERVLQCMKSNFNESRILFKRKWIIIFKWEPDKRGGGRIEFPRGRIFFLRHLLNRIVLWIIFVDTIKYSIGFNVNVEIVNDIIDDFA